MNHDGQPYYFNPITMQSQWDPPAELLQPNPMAALSSLMGGGMGAAGMGGMGGMGGLGMPGMGGAGFPFDPSFLQTMVSQRDQNEFTAFGHVVLTCGLGFRWAWQLHHQPSCHRDLESRNALFS